MEKESFETFMKICGYSKDKLIEEDPSCFNGEVSIRKYKVTIELVDEPKEVLIARLRKLWSECNNHHHWGPLRAEAKKLGIKLDLEDLGK